MVNNPFKDFLKPKYVLGLQVEEDFIGAVQVFNGLNGPEIDKAAFKEISNPSQVQEELKAFIEEEELKTEMVISSLPTSRALMRELDLTVDNPKILQKIIKFQLEPYVPVPIEEMMVDFIDPVPGESVSTFGVEKKHLAEHLALLAGAGIDPDVVTIDGLALLHLYLYKYGDQSEQPVAIVYLDKDSTLVEIVYQGRPDFFRIFADGKHGTDQIADTLQLYKLKRPGATVSEILISGIAQDDNNITQAVGSKAGVKTSLWRPFDDPLFQPRLSIPLGLALSAAQPSPRLVNLRKEEFAPKSHVNLRKMFLLSASALLLLAILLTANVYQKVYYLEKQHQALQNQVRQVFIQTFPEGAQRIPKGQELVLLERKIADDTGQYQGLEDATGREKTLDVLLKLTKVISQDPEIQIENLSVEGKDIRLDGRTSSFEAVDRLSSRLTKSGDFKNIKLVGAKTDKRENAVTFNFALEENR
jgi:Tfp pilus assembly PilM family ATPase/Tfp pilus assembly protein PilN